MIRLTLPLLVLACLACGPRAYIDLEIVSSRVVPDEVDNLTVAATDETGAEVGRGAYRLESGFPQHVILEPSSTTDATLEIWVTGFLGETEVARAGVRTTWREDAINDVSVALE
ncbi:MAG: hypothetical protein ACAI38_23155 [Myxococcota bacterium]|nr:hypothetical protein [Myxococcota bacterium]